MHKFFGILTATILLVGAAHAEGEYKNSQRFIDASKRCGGLLNLSENAKDKAAKQFESLSEKEFVDQLWDCYDPEWRRVGIEAVLRKRGQSVQQKPTLVGASEYAPDRVAATNSMNSVASDGRRIKRDGKELQLKNLGGGNAKCIPPRSLHPTNECRPIDGGGVRCKMSCY